MTRVDKVEEEEGDALCPSFATAERRQVGHSKAANDSVNSTMCEDKDTDAAEDDPNAVFAFKDN